MCMTGTKRNTSRTIEVKEPTWAPSSESKPTTCVPHVRHAVGLVRDEQGPSAYIVITTDADGGLSGSGFVFTVGRGNDVVVAAIDSLSRVLVGRNVENLPDDMRAAWDMPTTFSCAGSARRRASSTWPSASCSARHRPDRGRRRRADAEPHHVQAVSAGG